MSMLREPAIAMALIEARLEDRRRSFHRLLEVMAQAQSYADYRGQTCWIARRLHLRGQFSEFAIVGNPQAAKRRRMQVLCEVKPCSKPDQENSR